MTAEKIRSATTDDEHLSRLLKYVLHGWAPMRFDVQKGLQLYTSFRDGCVIIDIITKKGKRKIPASLQEKAQYQVHINLMDIEKTRLLTCESIYWINMNAYINETVKMPYIS